LALNDIAFPGNAAFFYSYLLKIAAFDPLPTDDFFDAAWNFPHSEPIGAQFGALGYETKYFAKNMGTPYLFSLIMLVCLTFIPCLNGLHAITSLSCVKSASNWLQEKLLWNSILVLLTENFLLIAISGCINLTELQFSNASTTISSVSCIIFLLLLIALPIFIFRFLDKKYHVLKNKQIQARYGSMFSKLDLNKGRLVIAVPMAFFVRRVLLSLTVVWLRGYPVFQIFITNFSVLAVIILHGQIEPYATRFENRLETFNELLVVGIVYHMCIFSPWVYSAQRKYGAGWSIIAITCFNIAVNILVLLFNMIKGAINYCRKKKELKAVKKHMDTRIKLQSYLIARMAAQKKTGDVPEADEESKGPDQSELE